MPLRWAFVVSILDFIFDNEEYHIENEKKPRLLVPPRFSLTAHWPSFCKTILCTIAFFVFFSLQFSKNYHLPDQPSNMNQLPFFRKRFHIAPPTIKRKWNVKKTRSMSTLDRSDKSITYSGFSFSSRYTELCILEGEIASRLIGALCIRMLNQINL